MSPEKRKKEMDKLMNRLSKMKPKERAKEKSKLPEKDQKWLDQELKKWARNKNSSPEFENTKVKDRGHSKEAGELQLEEDLWKRLRSMSPEERAKYLKKAGVSGQDYKDWDRHEEKKIKEAKNKLSDPRRAKKTKGRRDGPERSKTGVPQEDTVDSAKGKPVPEYKEALEKLTRSKHNGSK
jgi:hypothetical protein